jgi:hypothetical protein
VWYVRGVGIQLESPPAKHNQHLGFVGREHVDLGGGPLVRRARGGNEKRCYEGLDRIFRQNVDMWT